MLQANDCYTIFQQSIDDYHLQDDVDTPIKNPFPAEVSMRYCMGKIGSIRYNGIWKILFAFQRSILWRH